MWFSRWVLFNSVTHGLQPVRLLCPSQARILEWVAISFFRVSFWPPGLNHLLLAAKLHYYWLIISFCMVYIFFKQNFQLPDSQSVQFEAIENIWVKKTKTENPCSVNLRVWFSDLCLWTTLTEQGVMHAGILFVLIVNVSFFFFHPALNVSF